MTNDFIDDACDLLDRSGGPYVVLFGDGPVTKVVSNLGDENLPMIEDWIESGHIELIFQNHIERIKKKRK